MRKVLLTSTALVALGVSAASAADISISGNSTFNYKSISDSNVYSGAADGNSMSIGGELYVTSTATSDSGMTYTTSIDAANGDEAVLTVSADFGKVSIKQDEGGDGDAAAMSGDVAADETTSISSVKFDGDEAVAGGMVSYASPSISGANIYAGYSDGGANNSDATTSFGIKYATEAAGASVTLGYAASSADNGYDATSYGVKVSANGLAVTLAANGKEDSDESYEGTSIGLTYTVSDAMAIQVHSKNAEDSKNSNYDYSESAISATYTIASGLTSAITYTNFEYNDGTDAVKDNSGSATNIELKVAF